VSAERGLNPAGEEHSVAERFITEWLARAHRTPETARKEWADQGVALLPCGRAFAAVRIPAVLVHAAVGTDDPQEIAEALPVDLGGPVIHDGYTGYYYPLIQHHAGLVWDGEEDTPCLGPESYLGVPRLSRREPPGPHWVVTPRRDGDLCRPQMVREFIARARLKLAPAGELAP
jgi:hypothetical protein